MQSAIAKHLQCPRSQAKRVADDYAPPYPAWVARSNEALQQVVMGYFGIQWRGAQSRGAAFSALEEVESSFSKPDGPAHVDRAHYLAPRIASKVSASPWAR
jgi:aldoxime dehydratase